MSEPLPEGRPATRMPTGVEGSTSPIATLRRTVTEFREDGMTDWAAALTYYALLSLFPALIAVSSLIGLVTDADTLTRVVVDVAPGSAADTLSGPIDSITSNTGAAGVALVLGVAGALWGASGYTAAFGRAGNVIYEVREGRPFWRLRPVQILVTLVNVVLLVAVVIALVMSGPLLEAVAEPMGLGDTALSVWSWAKWPVLLAAAMVLLVVLYALTPNVRQRTLLSVLPGALVALALWGVATAGFAFYTGNFGSYDRTYGTLGGVVVLLVWIWLTNVALLLGAEFNSERERSREIAEGMPGARREIQLPVRDEPDPPVTH